MLKRIIFILVALLALIQIIRPDKITTNDTSGDVSVLYTTPDDVKSILKTACYDCHSNEPAYPWYFNVQPVGWWLQSHIDEGRHHLNFSAFKNYDAKKADHKMEEVIEVIQQNEMPLGSYTLLHKEAKLSETDKQKIIEWAKSVRLKIRAGDAVQP